MADGEAGRTGGTGVSFSAALGAVICARVAAGESLMAVCRDAGMPHRTTVRNWTHARPEFGQALAAAQRAKRVAWRARDRARMAVWKARPAPARGGQPSTYTPEVGEEICWRLSHGQSLLAIGADPAMPCPGTVYGWLLRHPDFLALYETARENQAHFMFDEAREVAQGATAETASADRLRFDAIRWATARLSPKKYAERGVALAAEPEAAAEAAEGPQKLQMIVCRFEYTPEGECVVTPPRNSHEEAVWERVKGRPYDGPFPLDEAERAQADAEWQARQARLARLARKTAADGPPAGPASGS